MHNYKKGGLFFLSAMFFSCFNDVLAKLLMSGPVVMPAFQFIFFRSFGGFLLLWLYFLFFQKKEKLLAAFQYHQLLRALLLSLAFFLFNKGLKSSSVTVATIFTLVMPVFILFFTPLFFPSQRIRLQHWVTTFIACIGLTILTYDGRTGLLYKGSVALFFGLLLFSLTDLLHKKYTQPKRELVDLFFLLFFMACLTAIPTLRYGIFPTSTQSFYSFLFVGSGLLGFFTLLKSYSYVHPAVLAPIRYVTYIFAIGFDQVIFFIVPQQKHMIGLFLIMTTTLYNYYYLQREEK